MYFQKPLLVLCVSFTNLQQKASNHFLQISFGWIGEELHPTRSVGIPFRESGCSKMSQMANADLRGADLSGSNMAGANLASANLAGANLSDADLAGARLDGADLSGAIMDRCAYFIVKCKPPDCHNWTSGNLANIALLFHW